MKVNVTPAQINQIHANVTHDTVDINVCEGTRDDMIIVTFFGKNKKLIRDMTVAATGKVMYLAIPCEICGNVWDSISPCAPCNATR